MLAKMTFVNALKVFGKINMATNIYRCFTFNVSMLWGEFTAQELL